MPPLLRWRACLQMREAARGLSHDPPIETELLQPASAVGWPQQRQGAGAGPADGVAVWAMVVAVAEVVVAALQVVAVAVARAEALPLLPLPPPSGCQHRLAVFGPRSACLEHRLRSCRCIGWLERMWRRPEVAPACLAVGAHAVRSPAIEARNSALVLWSSQLHNATGTQG